MNDFSPALSRRQALKISAVAGVSLALGGGALTALVRAGSLHQIAVTRGRMGTLVTMTVLHPDASRAREVVESAFSEMERLEEILSRHRSTTALARLNRDGRIDEAPEELLEVVERALNYSTLTGGAFDVTIAPLLELYRSRFAATGKPPTDSEIEKALARVDHRAVHMDGSSITLGKPGMALTLDGIAKGYIVDRTLAHLVGSGVDRVMVNGGGDVTSTRSRIPGEEWTVGIQHPRDERGLLGAVLLDGNGVATSGDYMQSFSTDRKHHHIIDPRTGRSPESLSSVTVIARTAMDADALSTAVLVLGPRDGVELVDGQDDTECLIVAKSGERYTSRGVRRHVGRWA